MSIKLLNCTALTGGGVRALDSHSIADIADGYRAHTVDSDKFYFHAYDATGTDAENSPNVIRPDDYAGAGVWRLKGSPYGDLAVMPEVVSGLPTEGGISGGDIARTSDHVLTISPTSCLSSDWTTQLYNSTALTVTIPTVANTIYHIFIVKLVADGSMEFRAYTTEAAVASDAQVSKYRWVGFWRTNGSSNLVIGAMVGGVIVFGKGSENIITTALTTAFATINHAAMLPESRALAIEYGVRHASVNTTVISSIDGTNTEFMIGDSNGGTSDTVQGSWNAINYQQCGLIPFISGRLFKSEGSSTTVLVRQVVVRR